MTKLDLQELRRDYLMGGLERDHLDQDPFKQFSLWMQQAIELEVQEPNAMTIATVSAEGQPSQRIVLLKHADSDGLVFYTNYGSRKAEELAANPRVSAHFPWHSIERQVKICGVAEKISAAESLKYFASRPRDSQVAAAASNQSSVLSSRSFLLNQFQALKQKYRDGQIPLPDFWGGYRVKPHEFEFWQGGASRLHDRFRYLKQESGWQIDRLAP